MYPYKSQAGWHEIDGQRVYLDSKSEAIFLRRLVKNGFSGKWRRPRGVAYGNNRYTPDFELSANWKGREARVHVEYKPTSATQFTMRDRQRALAALHYYGSNPILLLYIGKTKRWYHINSSTQRAVSCPAPQPSGQSIITQTPARKGITTLNRYGRTYKTDIKALIGNTVADLLEAGVRLVFGGSKRKRRR